MSAFDVPEELLYSSASACNRPTPERERLMLKAIDSALSVVAMMSMAHSDTEWNENNAIRKTAAIASVYGTLVGLENRDNMDLTALKGVAAVELFFAFNPSKRPEPMEEKVGVQRSTMKPCDNPKQATKQDTVASRPWHPAGRRTVARPSPLRTAVVARAE